MPVIMADRNFKAEQLVTKHPEDDVSLFDGKGFMVESAPYDAHLKATPDRTAVGGSFLVLSTSSLVTVLAENVDMS